MCCKIWIKRELHSCSEIYSKLDFISRHVYDMYVPCMPFPFSGQRHQVQKKAHPQVLDTCMCCVCFSESQFTDYFTKHSCMQYLLIHVYRRRG